MSFSATTYAAAKKFTEETADEFGAIKGAPCEIVSIEDVEVSGRAGHKVTFQWENSDGETRQDYTVLFDGEDGVDAIPAGGTKGQVLAKKSSADGDVEWKTGGGGGSDLSDDLTASVSVGGVTAGDSFEEGTSLEVVVRNILSPTLYPTLTNPSATISVAGATLLEKGSTVSKTFTLTLNRGSINPAYGTSGYRSGPANQYTLKGDTSLTNQFTLDVSESDKSYQGSIAYDAGEQPKDSNGANYSTPLAAGSVNTNTINFEFVDALWANTASISTVAKLALVSKSTKLKRFDFPAQTVSNPEVFDVPSSWTITAIEVLNTMSNQWENCSSEFTTSSVTHEDAGGNTVSYTRYTDNRGYNAGARAVRIKWS